MSKKTHHKFVEGGKMTMSTPTLFGQPFGRSKTTEGGNDVNELESLFADMMLCQICQEVYRDPYRLPKALPCTHTYCAPCLGNHLVETMVECPECGVRYDVRGDIGNLPNSAMVMRILDKVCKFCGTMAKIEECPHCKWASCAVCLKGHMNEIREELYINIQEISSATEQLSSKQNLIDNALAELMEKVQKVKSDVAYETDQLVEMVTQRHEKVIEQIDKEVSKERKRLNKIKKALVDTQDTNLALCSGLSEELEQPIQLLAQRFNTMKNNCAVQLDKIKRENAAMLSLEWDLALTKPDHTFIKKELEELHVEKTIPKTPSSPRVTRVRIQTSSGNRVGFAKNKSFSSEANSSFAKTNKPRRRSESSF